MDSETKYAKHRMELEDAEGAENQVALDSVVSCPSCGAGDEEEDLIIHHENGTNRCRLECVCGVCGPWAEPADCEEAWRLWEEMPRRTANLLLDRIAHD